jgi:isopenicillin-N epimerase
MLRGLQRRIDDARARLAAFLRADAGGLVFVTNATTGVNTVLRSLAFDAGDEIVATAHAYGAVKQALRFVEERTSTRVVTATVPFPIQSPAQIVEAVAAALSERTRLLVVDHVTSPTALIFPVAELVALAHARGVPVLVDGAHAPGMLPLDLEALGADFYTGNLHKWVCAPKGAAFLWVAAPHRDRIYPLTISHGHGRGLHAEFDWPGTFDPSAWLAVPAALEHFEALGPERVRAETHALVREGRRAIAEALRVELPHPDDPALYGQMACIPFPHREPARWDLLMQLSARMYEEHRIEAPFTAFDARIWVRISAQVYNRPEDYARLARVLEAWRPS